MHFVASESEFNAAAAVAQPGDVVIIRNGTYTSWKLRIPSVGTATNPIVYSAQTPGSVKFSGTHQDGLVITGRYNIVGGFVFEKCGPYFVRITGGKYNRFTDSVFRDCGGYDTDRLIELHNGANYNRIDHIDMARSTSMAIALYLPRPGIDKFATSLYNRIDHNTIHDMGRGEGDGRAPIQIGQWEGDGLWADSFTTIEHNRFENVYKSINSKSNGEIYRHNQFINSGGISLRGGDNKRIEANLFKNVTIPLHIYGRGHHIVNNEIINPETAILIPKWGDYQITESGKISTSPPTGSMLIAHNTIINSTVAGVEIGRTWGYTNRTGWVVATNLPTEIRFVNNIFTGSAGTLFKYLGGSKNVISHNLYHVTGTAQAGNLGQNAILEDPDLSVAREPNARSAAVDSGMKLTEVGVDAATRTRPVGAAADLGAYERR